MRVWTLNQSWNVLQIPKFQYLNLEDGQTQEWLEADSAMLPGESWILNFSDAPRYAEESFLLQILQPPEDVPDDAFLSRRACQGILNRSAKKGKELPQKLKIALMAQMETLSSLKSDNQKLKVGGGCGAMWRGDKAYTIATHQDMTLFDFSHADSVAREYKTKSPTINARAGTGGNQMPCVLTYCIQGKHDKQTVATFASKSFAEWVESNKGATLKACGGSNGGGSESLVVVNEEINENADT